MENNNDKERRKIMGLTAAGGTLSVVASALPSSWSKPLISAVITPAHAQTSASSPSVSLSTSSLDLGSLATGANSNGTVTLTNTGNTDISVTAITSNNAAFTITNFSAATILAANDTLDVTILATCSSTVETLTGEISFTLTSNGGTVPSPTLNITAECIETPPSQTFMASDSITIPAGVSSVDIIAAGAAGASTAGATGGAGSLISVSNIAVSQGMQLTINIGAGGGAGGTGFGFRPGTTAGASGGGMAEVLLDGNRVIVAGGGGGAGAPGLRATGGNGGSGGSNGDFGGALITSGGGGVGGSAGGTGGVAGTGNNGASGSNGSNGSSGIGGDGGDAHMTGITEVGAGAGGGGGAGVIGGGGGGGSGSGDGPNGNGPYAGGGGGGGSSFPEGTLVTQNPNSNAQVTVSFNI